MKITSSINGSLSVIRLYRAVSCCCLVLIFTGCASAPPPPEPPSGDDEELLELLEYLLEFEDDDGEWVDPQEVSNLQTSRVQFTRKLSSELLQVSGNY